MDKQEELRYAVLVDAENVSHSWIKLIMAEIARYGTPTIKRIYTDWTQPAAGGWKNVLLEYAFTPMQQYRYTAGKNSSDSAMIIDAMDILYSQKVDGFCIVSSDSDFTRLAQRLREAGVPTAVYYPVPIHRQKPYAGYPAAPGGLPVTEAKAGRVISLPMHPYLEGDDQDQVIAAIRAFVKKNG